MIKNTLLTIVFLILSIAMTYAQNSRLKGTILDKETREGIPFVYIVLLQNSIIIKATSCSYSGDYSLKPIKADIYDMKVSSAGFQTVLVKGIIIEDWRVEFLDVLMKPETNNPMDVEVLEYEVPAIYYDTTRSGTNASGLYLNK